MGVTGPAVGTPGVYSNTNYLLLGELLEQVTGTTAELAADPYLNRPHSKIYEAWFGMNDPPRDYGVYDM